MLFKCLTLFGAFMAAANAQCDTTYCKTTPLVTCGHSGTFASTCDAGVQLIDMSSYRSTIVNEHNKYRQQLALGNVANHAKAAAMPEVQYDTSLENLAKYNALNCAFKHDCHNTATFPYSGQNLYMTWGSLNTSPTNVGTLLKNGMKSWWDENKDSSMAYINSYSSPPYPTVIGHFTVMANYKSTKVGCSGFIVPNSKLHFVCNYSYTNMLNRPVYVSSSSTGSACLAPSAAYAGLCAHSDVTNFNFW